MKGLTDKQYIFLFAFGVYLLCFYFLGFDWFGAIVAIPATLSALPLAYGVVVAIRAVLRPILKFLERL